MKMTDILSYLVGFFIFLIVMIFLISNYIEYSDNEKQYGITVSDKEIQCMQTCKPYKYFYEQGGFFAATTCTCNSLTFNKDDLKLLE